MSYIVYNLVIAAFVGNTKDQITNTVKYYRNECFERIQLPKDNDLKRTQIIRIESAFPLCNPKHTLEVKVKDDVVLRVNANAFEHVRQMAKYYKELKRGDLYEFCAGVAVPNYWLLPKDIMQAIHDFKWQQYTEHTEAWLEERERALNEAERNGFLIRMDEPESEGDDGELPSEGLPPDY